MLRRRGLSRTLVADETGTIEIPPAAFVDSATARAWFEELRDGGRVAFSERRRMYDRDVDVPRLVRAVPARRPGLPRPSPSCAAARRRDRRAVQPRGLNLYRDGRDSVAPHNDHLYEIVAGHPIALISLGRDPADDDSQQDPRRRAAIFDLDLENGSLLLMSYETQLHYDHGDS